MKLGSLQSNLAILCAIDAALLAGGCGAQQAHSESARIQFLTKALKTPDLPPQVRARFQKEYELQTHQAAPAPVAN